MVQYLSLDSIKGGVSDHRCPPTPPIICFFFPDSYHINQMRASNKNKLFINKQTNKQGGEGGRKKKKQQTKGLCLGPMVPSALSLWRRGELAWTRWDGPVVAVQRSET